MAKEQDGECLFEKTLSTLACNMLRTLGNQNIACDIPPIISGEFSPTCNKQNDF